MQGGRGGHLLAARKLRIGARFTALDRLRLCRIHISLPGIRHDLAVDCTGFVSDALKSARVICGPASLSQPRMRSSLMRARSLRAICACAWPACRAHLTARSGAFGDASLSVVQLSCAREAANSLAYWVCWRRSSAWQEHHKRFACRQPRLGTLELFTTVGRFSQLVRALAARSLYSAT